MQRVIHLGFVLILCYLTKPFFVKGSNKNKSAEILLKYIPACLVLSTTIYIISQYPRLVARWAYVSEVTTPDLVFGTVFIILVLEAARRSIGLPLVIIPAVFIIFGLVGSYLPGIFSHRGFSWVWIIDHLFLGTEGVFGIPIGVSATYAFLFIIMGALIEATGTGQFFIDAATSVLGHQQGGPAKIAVVASSFFGSISGSAVANVYGTGSFTIPLMIKTGYRRIFAGATEAVSSTGGQIMPPVMGAAAFLVAEFVGVSYLEVVKCALFPALLYYLALFLMITIEAKRTNLRGMDKESLPKIKDVIKKSYHVLPIVILIIVLVLGYSPTNAALSAIAVTCVIALIEKGPKRGFKIIIGSLEKGAKNCITLAVACAAAGVVVGMLSLTGFAFKFSSVIITLSGGYLFLLLFFTMISALILGMGMPTPPAYIFIAALGAPAIIQMGVMPIQAHLFVFYFACISTITPPVAISAYAGANIAGAPVFKTGIEATRLGIVAYIVPYMFVYGPSLLLIGSLGEIVHTLLTAILGTIALAVGVQGWLYDKLSLVVRFMCIACALLLLIPGLVSDFAGIAFLLVIGLLFILRRRTNKVVDNENVAK
jgi:TRAP transporter 4TM/12TM fusion protein